MSTDGIYDLMIIGGGINGVSIAREAAARGLRVCLCEQNDLGSGTSAWSSKLIHGGLRYLEQRHFSLVKHALKEREILLQQLPFLVRPLKFIFPHLSSRRPRWVIRIGLFLYDCLARSSLLPRCRQVDLSTSTLVDDLKTGFSYFDAQTDDCRLVVMNALQAQKHGAKILNYHRCIATQWMHDKWHIICETPEGEKKFFKSKVIVNASGPWINEVLTDCFQMSQVEPARLVKGSHIVVPKMYTEEHAYILQDSVGRVVFTIPYEGQYTLIGTTEIDHKQNTETASITAEEIDYLFGLVARYFTNPPSKQDIVWSFSGFRVLYAADKTAARKASREHYLQVEKAKQVVHVFGGKLTTHRVLANEVMAQCVDFLPQCKNVLDDEQYMKSMHFGGKTYEEFSAHCLKQYEFLNPALVNDYLRRYGPFIHDLLNDVGSVNDLGECFAERVYAKELDYLIRCEWVQRVEDILWRRTKHGLTLSKEQTARVEEYVSQAVPSQ